jgi:hypothetical protein
VFIVAAGVISCLLSDTGPCQSMIPPVRHCWNL